VTYKYEYMNYKRDPKHNLTEHFKCLRDLEDKLEEIGEPISDTDKRVVQFSSLPNYLTGEVAAARMMDDHYHGLFTSC